MRIHLWGRASENRFLAKLGITPIAKSPTRYVVGFETS